MGTTRLVIFTDLDGTLLDRESYSYEKAGPALAKLKANRIPLVFCSAKTRAEQEVYRRELGINDPFIVEDGGAIFIERDYFGFPFEYHKSVANYRVVEFGTPYWMIRNALLEVALDTQLNLPAFGTMSIEQVSEATGLDADAASRAKTREYEETLVRDFTPEELSRLKKALAREGLRLTHGGRFHGVIGNNDKGQAAHRLISLFRQQDGPIFTVGIGDSRNDASMLSVVDLPLLVEKEPGRWENLRLQRIRRVSGVGPEGWNVAVSEVLSPDFKEMIRERE
jgi:mannosyl-3-phosphoglycerate phosphatase